MVLLAEALEFPVGGSRTVGVIVSAIKMGEEVIQGVKANGIVGQDIRVDKGQRGPFQTRESIAELGLGVKELGLLGSDLEAELGLERAEGVGLLTREHGCVGESGTASRGTIGRGGGEAFVELHGGTEELLVVAEFSFAGGEGFFGEGEVISGGGQVILKLDEVDGREGEDLGCDFFSGGQVSWVVGWVGCVDIVVGQFSESSEDSHEVDDMRGGHGRWGPKRGR